MDNEYHHKTAVKIHGPTSSTHINKTTNMKAAVYQVWTFVYSSDNYCCTNDHLLSNSKRLTMSRFFICITLFFMIISCSSEEEPATVMEDPDFAFEGNWLGRWSDSLFPNVVASARVRSGGNNQYSGSFYYDTTGGGPYKPCCGAATDGSISFEVEGDRVINWLFIQNAPDYMGGCPGRYEGEGTLSADRKNLIITFTGDDCDGFHDNGRIVWTLDL